MLGSGSVAVSVSSNLYVFAAFGAGVISFVSPCVLPIVPGYLSLVTGLSVGEIREQQRHYLKRIAVNTGLFVLGLHGRLRAARAHHHRRGQRALPQPGDAHPHLRRPRAADGVLPRGVAAAHHAAPLPGVPLAAAPRPLRSGRGAGRGRRVRPRVDAVHRPDPRQRARLRRTRREPRARRPSCSSRTRSASACRSSPSASPWASSPARSNWFKRHSRAITLVSAAILAVFGIILLTNSLPTMTARMSDFLRSNGFGWLVDAG